MNCYYTSSKAEYLKKYLSENAEEKKKKKKRKTTGASVKVTKSRIVDDDIDLKQLLPENLSNTLEEDVGDNDPIVAEFIDERPEHVKQLEKYRTSGAWKLMGDSENSEDSQSPKRARHDSDSDPSPPRRGRHDSNSDQSPPRRKRHDSDSDPSPPRRKRHDSNSDQSPPRKKGKKIENFRKSDRRFSPAPKPNSQRKKSRFSDIEPSDRNSARQVSDSYRGYNESKKHDKISSRKRYDSDSDNSPPRRKRHDSNSDQSPPRRKRNVSDSDQSPPRKNRHDSDSDQSPPRRKTYQSRRSRSPQHRRRQDSDSDLSPPRQSRDKEQKTLGGKRAGLSSALEMRREAHELRQKENDKFNQISDEKLGKGAATVFRDRKSGKRRDLEEEKRQASEESRKKAKEDEKYQKWGKGVKQAEQQNVMMEEALHEANKPLARYRDDDDLDRMLREMDRAEDPMLAFIKKKKKGNEEPKKEKPRYKGPLPPPNRFGILPGYRWDSVDRSNGFEKQVFAKRSEDKARASAAYKWSVEDM